MPHFEQVPGWSAVTSGCIGHAYTAAATAVLVAATGGGALSGALGFEGSRGELATGAGAGEHAKPIELKRRMVSSKRTNAV
jgi:hypothetical protein